MKLPTVFFGGSEYVLPIMQVLNLKLVVTTENDPAEPVISYCLQKNIPYITTKNRIDTQTFQILEKNITDVAVLANFGLIIPHKILTLYPKGIVNVHPSLLPKYRGPTPGQSTILHGDNETGVTLIKLDDEVDHGGIIAQKEKILPSYYTTKDLYSEMFSEGAQLLKENLEKYVNGVIHPQEQNHNEATFTPKLTRQNGYFDIQNPPSPAQLDRMIRAYYPWPGAWTQLEIGFDGQKKILKLLPSRKPTPGIADPMEILLQVEGKKPVSIKDFVNGYPHLEKQIKKLLLFSPNVAS